MKFKIVSLGCPKNLVESEYIAEKLEKKGHILTEGCDAVIINTCAFIADAAKESVETILEEALTKKKIIVTGCLVERYKEKLPELLPEVDLFVGRNYYDEIEAIVDETLNPQRISPLIKGNRGGFSEKKCFFQREGSFAETFPRKVLTALPSAYLKIQEGCDNRCSYCTVPDIRGGLRSRDPKDILTEFEWLLDNGFREINIIGQDITSYGRHENMSLAELLGRLLKIGGDYFLRLLYMHPKGLNAELISLIQSDERIVKYMDVPIQHSEDRILSSMGRGYTKLHLENLLGVLREKIPEAVLRTTVIVGFPGETEEDFDHLCDFVRKWEFDMLGAFMYSREENTQAHRIKGHVKKGVKKARYNSIMETQREISKKKLSLMQGKTALVIVEGKSDGHMVGRLLTQAPDIDGVAFIKGDCAKGEIISGKIVKTLDYDVIVEVQKR